MMTVIALIVQLFEAFKTVSPVVLAIVSGLGMILTKGLAWGIPELFQALVFVFSGAFLADLRSDLARLESLIHVGTSPLAAPAPAPAPAPVPAPAANTDQPAKAS